MNTLTCSSFTKKGKLNFNIIHTFSCQVKTLKLMSILNWKMYLIQQSGNHESVSPSGKQFTLKNTLKGWMVYGSDNLPISGNLNSAYEVEFFVVNGLQNS